jgi:hypothetical protein
MNPHKRLIRVSREIFLLPNLFFFFLFFFGCFKTHFFLEGKTAFPARGFAKILTKDEASDRLDRYRSFIVRDLNTTSFHKAYAFRFRLRHMPRRGEEFSKTGTIFGLALGHGLSRIDLDSIDSGVPTTKFLLYNGPRPKVWKFSSSEQESKLLQDAELFKPILNGMNQSTFDLLMPFVFWNATYIKSGKVAGRPSHLYSFLPPQWVKDIRPDIKEIVMALDQSYEAPLRIETFSRSNVPSRTFILNGMKKIADHWIVKSLDCKNLQDRSNTRFEVTSAALNLDLDMSLFSPGGLLGTPVIPLDTFISTK